MNIYWKAQQYPTLFTQCLDSACQEIKHIYKNEVVLWCFDPESVEY